MVEELLALQAKGLIFLIIFGFFVENHLIANTKSSFYDLQFESYNLCRHQALFLAHLSSAQDELLLSLFVRHPCVCPLTFSNDFSSEAAEPILLKFHVEPP